MLGELLLIIGRQVQLDEGRDRIDLLALDQAGKLVVIELKRDRLGGSVDIQALRYAALVGGWSHDDVRRQAEGYWKSTNQQRGTFAQEVESFCEDGYQINADQRVILVGQEIKPRLGTMAVWLRRHGVDVVVVSLGLFKDPDSASLYVQPQVLIPPPSEERVQAKVAIGSSDQPWLRDGQAWHLEQRCSPKGREIVEYLVEVISKSVPDAEGPNWSQKFYVSWTYRGRSWVRLITFPNQANLAVMGLTISPSEAAERLGWEEFQGEAELAEKFALGSNVGAGRREGAVRFIVKSLADLQQEPARTEFLKLLRESWLGLTGELVSTASLGESSGDSALPGP